MPKKIFRCILAVGLILSLIANPCYGAKVTSAKTNFTKGEFSPLLLGRIDIAAYANGAKKIENFLIHNAGGATRRPGSKYVAKVKDSTKATRVIDFQFSTDQAYILELGESYIRFYTDQGQVQNTTHAITGVTQAATAVVTSANHPFQNGDSVTITEVEGMTELNGNAYTVANRAATTYELSGVNSTGFGAYTGSAGIATRSGALEIPNPYTEAQLFDIQFAQSADVMYLVHPSHEPMKLERLSATSWQLTEITFVGGPFLDDNLTAITLNPSGTVIGAINVVASAVFFEAGHVGAIFKIHGTTGDPAIQGYFKILTVNVDGLNTTATVVQTLSASTATTDWAEGAWSDVQGFPGSVTFHEQRLVFGGAGGTNNPQKVYASVSQSFEDMTAGTGNSDAFIYKIATEQVNAIRWLSSGRKALQVGTSGSTFSFSSGAVSSPITPSSIVVQRDTTYGSSKLLPKRIGSFVYFIQRDLVTLLELGFDFDTDGQEVSDMTLLSDHITGDGIVDMAYQQAPNNTLWCVRSDGEMATLTRQIDQEVIGWSRQISGSDTRGAGLYESVAVVPIDEGDDEVWVVVKRFINDSSVRYIEFFMPREFDAQHDAFFVDSGLTLDSPIVISGATKTNPVVLTTATHGFSDGDQVKIIDVIGMTEINDEFYLVANKDATTFELTDLSGNNIDGSAFTTYISGGEVRKMVTTISNLGHLKSETVAVIADGGARPNNTVSAGGEITLASKAAVVHVGLPYTPTIQGLPLVDGSATGTGAGKVRRIYKAIIRFYRTLGAQFGDENTQDPIEFLDPSVPLNQAPPLFTGIKEVDVPAGWDRLGEIYITQPQPLPITILYFVLLSDVSDE